jgi:dTDP-glucose 4,6-dehydratase
MENTIAWYLENRHWVENVRSGAYREYYDLHYGEQIHLVPKAA